VPLITDFAQSCNTAFASLAPKLGPNGLTTTAAQLGIGGKWNVGLPTLRPAQIPQFLVFIVHKSNPRPVLLCSRH